VTTPREQLIEAIAEAVRTPIPEPVGDQVTDDTQAFQAIADGPYVHTAKRVVQALSDLGAVVLMPVTPGESVANVIVLNEKHVLKTTQEERDEGVYINALEGEQS
jgi:hypothetical protein